MTRRRFTTTSVATLCLALTACHAAPTAVAHQSAPPSSADAKLETTRRELTSARYALEPARTAVQRNEAASVPTMSDVAPEWIMLRIADLQDIADNTAVPAPSRAEAHRLAALGEGLLVEHFTTLFWNKAEPGRRVIAHLQAALALDPTNEPAAVSYAFSLFGIRNSGFRSQAEDMMGVSTTPELTRVAGLLVEHRDSLLAQSLVRTIGAALADDAPIDLEAGLDSRIAGLRAEDPAQAEEVDDALSHYVK